MSTPPHNPYAHNPDPDGESTDSSGSGFSPYGQPQGQNPGQPYGQPYNAPMPYGGYEQQPGYQPQQPSYPNGMHSSSGMGWGANTSKNSLGGWALGTGIAGVLCCGLAAIPALIVGILGRKAADEGLATNKGMATAGMVLGIVGIGIWVVATVLNFSVGFGEIFYTTY